MGAKVRGTGTGGVAGGLATAGVKLCAIQTEFKPGFCTQDLKHAYRSTRDMNPRHLLKLEAMVHQSRYRARIVHVLGVAIALLCVPSFVMSVHFMYRAYPRNRELAASADRWSFLGGGLLVLGIVVCVVASRMRRRLLRVRHLCSCGYLLCRCGAACPECGRKRDGPDCV